MVRATGGTIHHLIILALALLAEERIARVAMTAAMVLMSRITRDGTMKVKPQASIFD